MFFTSLVLVSFHFLFSSLSICSQNEARLLIYIFLVVLFFHFVVAPWSKMATYNKTDKKYKNLKRVRKSERVKWKMMPHSDAKRPYFSFTFVQFLLSYNLFALMIIIIDAVNGVCMREFFSLPLNQFWFYTHLSMDMGISGWILKLLNVEMIKCVSVWILICTK